ncbi:MAG TPA: phosphate acyltransferase PlsX [Stellaceae bacterium]|nr:phosphate acyltransferase PlsX [Stellaceae bacterium]
MSDKTVVALDAMGGDHAPDMVVKGAAIALQRFPQIEFLLFGTERRIRPLLEKLPALTQRSRIRHTDDFITGDAKPSTALRSGRNSSMRLALDAVASGEASCAVSAGNTGALMAMAKFALKTLPGIDRPAIATFFPTKRGESVMLDLGANVECDAENLVQFALMGEVFARTVLGLARPTVGLLNIGSEDSKGNDAVRGAALRLKSPGSPINFQGYVEGDEIGAGAADVIVTDGFTGNVALKTAEGTAKLFMEFVRSAFTSSLAARLGYVFAKPALKKLRERLDVRRYNGAVFLGLDGIAVKSHGGTDEEGFASAIGVGVDMCINGFLEKIRDDIARMSAVAEMTEKSQTAAL